MKFKNLIQKIGVIVLPSIINLIIKTIRIEYLNKSALEKENSVVLFWHGKMLAGWYSLRGEKVFGVVSQSKDGEILSRLLLKWGYQLIRGSSSKSSKEVMVNMEKLLEEGNYIALTPDGPRGPSQNMKIGGLIAAMRTHKPVVLVAILYKEKFIFKSWDKFELPKPFSKAIVMFSDPIYIRQGLTNDEYEQERQELEKRLNLMHEELAVKNYPIK